MSDIQPFEAVPNPLIAQPDFKVPADMDAAFDKLISHYPKKRSATLMLLHATQRSMKQQSPLVSACGWKQMV